MYLFKNLFLFILNFLTIFKNRINRMRLDIGFYEAEEKFKVQKKLFIKLKEPSSKRIKGVWAL